MSDEIEEMPWAIHCPLCNKHSNGVVDKSVELPILKLDENVCISCYISLLETAMSTDPTNMLYLFGRNISLMAWTVEAVKGTKFEREGRNNE